jgi:3-oxoacyl-[acyl-carrier-protein] synthase III
MPTCSIHNVRLAGVAAAVPPVRKMGWEELGVPPERFKRSRMFNSIPSVRAAKWEQCQSDFCERAAGKLLHELSWSPESVDLIIMVTVTPDYPIPATAIIMQDRLGLSKASVAFDLPGSTVTFFHGMQLVASMLSSGCLRRGLLLCGEVPKVVEGPDTIESVDQICGHNGSALAFEHAPGAQPMCFSSGGDGALDSAFYMPIGGTRRPPNPEMFSANGHADFDNPAGQFKLDVRVCNEAALRELPPSARAALTEAGKRVADIDFCFVQPLDIATEEALRAELGFRKDRFHGFTYEYGAGGSGGIPLGMLSRAASQLQTGPRSLLLTGIGAGLAWASAVISTDGIACPEFIEM